MNFQTAVDKLELKDGDTLLVNADAVSIENVRKMMAGREQKNMVMMLQPVSGQTLKDCIETVSLDELRRIIARMETVQ